MDWYYSEQGQQKGPVSESELQSLVSNGTVQPSDLIWREGMTDWLPVGQVPEISGSAPAAAPPAAPVSPAAPAAPINPYASPAAGGAAPQHRGPTPDIPNNLVWAILATVFCCVPFGIVAIVYASKVDNLVRLGDFAGAQKASDQAKTWSWVSCGATLLVTVVYIAIIVATEM